MHVSLNFFCIISEQIDIPMRAYTYFFDAVLLQALLCLLFGVILLFLNDPIYSFLFKTAVVSAIVVFIMAVAGVSFRLFLRPSENDDC